MMICLMPDQVARATNSVFNEMCHELDVKEYEEFVLKAISFERKTV